MFWTLFLFCTRPTQEPASVCNDEQPDLFFFIVRAHTGTDVRHNTGKIRERLWKNAGERTGRVEISKEEILGSRRSMHGCIRTCSRLKGRTFELWVLSRWVFYFCVCSTPLRDSRRTCHPCQQSVVSSQQVLSINYSA